MRPVTASLTHHRSGVAFAAWDTPPQGRQDWIARAASSNTELAQRLEQVLAHTRERGFDIDWTTPPALAQAAQLMGTATDLPTQCGS